MTTFTVTALLLFCALTTLVEANGASSGRKMMRGEAQKKTVTEVEVHRMAKRHGMHKIMPECGYHAVDMECVDNTRDDFFSRIDDNNDWLREDIAEAGNGFTEEIDEINEWVEEELEEARETCGGRNNNCYRRHKNFIQAEARDEYRRARMERKEAVQGTYEDYADAKREAMKQLKEELDMCCMTDMSLSFSFSFSFIPSFSM